jgi:hypothetical protein
MSEQKLILSPRASALPAQQAILPRGASGGLVKSVRRFIHM